MEQPRLHDAVAAHQRHELEELPIEVSPPFAQCATAGTLDSESLALCQVEGIAEFIGSATGR